MFYMQLSLGFALSCASLLAASNWGTKEEKGVQQENTSIFKLKNGDHMGKCRHERGAKCKSP